MWQKGTKPCKKNSTYNQPPRTHTNANMYCEQNRSHKSITLYTDYIGPKNQIYFTLKQNKKNGLHMYIAHLPRSLRTETQHHKHRNSELNIEVANRAAQRRRRQLTTSLKKHSLKQNAKKIPTTNTEPPSPDGTETFMKRTFHPWANLETHLKRTINVHYLPTQCERRMNIYERTPCTPTTARDR